jgi:mannose-6-phosphate isomerase-like protein (cupin superfamily)
MNKTGETVMTTEIPSEFQDYVITDLPRFFTVQGHHAPTPFWIAPEMFPGVNLGIAGLDSSKLVNVPHADPHVHDHPEIYMAVSETRGAITIEVQMNDARFKLESPFTLFIPPGVRHCFTVVQCEVGNRVFGILLPDWRPQDTTATSSA